MWNKCNRLCDVSLMRIMHICFHGRNCAQSDDIVRECDAVAPLQTVTNVVELLAHAAFFFFVTFHATVFYRFLFLVKSTCGDLRVNKGVDKLN